MAQYEVYVDGGDAHHSVLALEGIEFLLSADGKVPIASAMDGKTTCLFFSADWCRPCRKFTPHLVQLYNSLKNRGEKLEIIFVSFDRDEITFMEHFKHLPWLAIPFDVEVRRRLCNRYHIHRIPSLISLASDGKTIEEDAVQLVEDYGIEAFPFNIRRREELKAMDEAKRHGGALIDLLGSKGRDFIISKDGTQVPIADLVGKTIGLYFGAHWCPPCRTFMTALAEAYGELRTTKNESFQIVFVSTDRDEKEFNLSLKEMPWLAIPYTDKTTRHDLCRILDIKGIPTLVLLGPDGKALNSDGRAMISSYGAMAFPFTESRAVEVETTLRKEGEGLPRELSDSRHEHVLKLDMAKAYVCDLCGQQGRYWAYSCNQCDFDLHPACAEEAKL